MKILVKAPKNKFSITEELNEKYCEIKKSVTMKTKNNFKT